MSAKNIIALILGTFGFIGMGALVTLAGLYNTDVINILKSIISGSLFKSFDTSQKSVVLPDGSTIIINPTISYNICWIGPFKSNGSEFDGLKNKQEIIKILNEMLIAKNGEEVFKSEKPWLLVKTKNALDFENARQNVIKLTDLGACVSYGEFNEMQDYGNDILNSYQSFVTNNSIYVGE
jgi:hypothetical protein